MALERGEEEGGRGPSLPLLNEAEEAWDLQDVSFFPSLSLSLSRRIVPCCHVHIFMRLFGEADVEEGGQISWSDDSKR